MKFKLNWFETWFNTKYYDMMYKDRNETEAAEFLNRLINYLKPAANTSVLDLACGKGRHAKYLASKGFDITAIDISFRNIKEAKQFEDDNLSFFVHDMRYVFRVNYFDYVFNFFTSFGYFDNAEDNYRTIRSVALGLKKNGIFVIDFFNAEYILQHLIVEEHKAIGEIDFTIKKEFNNGFIEKEIHVIDAGEHLVFHERVRAITQNEFHQYFKRCSLTVLHVCGDYCLNPFDEKKSERLIMIVQK